MKRSTKTTKNNDGRDIRSYKKLPFEMQQLLKGTGFGGRGGITSIELIWGWDRSTNYEDVILTLIASYRNGDVVVYERNIYYPWCMKLNPAHERTVNSGDTYGRVNQVAKKETKAITRLFLHTPGAISVSNGGLIAGLNVNQDALNQALFMAGTGTTAQAAREQGWGTRGQTQEEIDYNETRAARSQGMTLEQWRANFGAPAAHVPVIEEGL